MLQAKEIAEANNCYDNLPSIYNCIANILHVSTILQKSTRDNVLSEEMEVVDMLKRSFSMSIKIKDYETMSYAMNNLIVIGMEDNGKYDLSDEIRQFRKYSGNSKNQIVRLTVLLCSAYEYFRQKNYDKAIAILDKAMTNGSNIPLWYRHMLICQGIKTNIYITTKQYDKAIASVRKSLSMAQENNGLDFVSSLYGNLAEIYSLKGDSVEASKYELLHYRSNEKLLSEGQLSSVKNVRFMRELNKANKQVRELSEKRERQNIMLICATVVLCVIAALLYRIYRANRKIKQNNEHLYLTNVELLAKETQARKQREEDEQKIKSLEEKVLALSDVSPEITVETTDSGVQKHKYQGSKMTDEDTKKLYASVLNVMESSEDIFRLGFNIDSLSELVHSRSRYVSQAINQEYGSNFNSLLNEYRIKEACRRLNGNPEYANMTIESIAESVGFKSRTSFGALFKKYHRSFAVSLSEYC